MLQHDLGRSDAEREHTNRHTEAKIKGYQQAYHERGLTPLPPKHCQRHSVKAAVEALREILSEVDGLEGILLTDNGFAPNLVHLLESRPVRLLGFGDEGFAELCEPRLSYMRFPMEAVVESGVNLLLNRINPVQPPRPFPAR